MKNLLTLLQGAIILIICLTACSKSKSVSDLQYKNQGWTCYVYDGDAPFSGEAWSEDGKSYKITVDCGKLNKIEYFDENGKLFCIVENENKVFFNEKGNEITRDDVRELYWDKYSNWKYNQQAALREVVEQHSKRD